MQLFKKKPSNHSSKMVCALLALCSILFIYLTPIQAQNLDVPYVPTPMPVVEKMLDMANVHAGDYVIDLGSGDGRIVIAAVKRGAYGHGIDLDPERIKEANIRAQEKGVQNKVMFLQQDLFKSDFSQASVVTMYLLPSVNKKLRPKLLKNLEPGSRVVSHDFDMGNWEPDKTANPGNGSDVVYMWIIPAQVDGNWSWSETNEQYNLSVQQQYQNAQLQLTSGNTDWQISNVVINGRRFSFKATSGNIIKLYSGRVEDDDISGYVQTYQGNSQTVADWNAELN